MDANPGIAKFAKYAGTYNQHISRALPPSLSQVDGYTSIKAKHLVKLLVATFPGRNDLAILDAGCGTSSINPYRKNYFQ